MKFNFNYLISIVPTIIENIHVEHNKHFIYLISILIYIKELNVLAE